MGRSQFATCVLATGFLLSATALAGCGTVINKGVALAGHDHRAGGPGPARALAFARKVLARQAIPPGARALTGPPPVRLAAAEGLGGPEVAVDLVRFYQVPGTEDSVLNFITRHCPAGKECVGGGKVGSRHGTTEEFVNYFVNQIPVGVSAAMLVADVRPAQSGGTVLRIDAFVTWAPLRTAAEHVNPASYRAVELVVDRTPPNSGTVTRTITSRAVVAKLASRLNAMRTAGNGGYGCPLDTTIRDRLTFEPRSGAVRQLTATLMPCDFVQVRVDGKVQPTLSDRGNLRGFIDRLIRR